MTSLMLTGDKALDKKLRELPTKLQKKAIRTATREAAKRVLEEAKRLVPVDEGLLEKSLVVRAATRGARDRRLGRGVFGHTVTTREGLFQGETFYGGFVEFGTKKWEGDAFLVPALFGTEREVRGVFVRALQKFVRTA